MIVNGWFDWALRDPGPASAVNGGRNGGMGIVPHSAEGHWDTLEDLHDFHWGRALAPPGKRASWGATNLQDGRFVQHYSVWDQTWTSGCGYLNNNFFAFENEGWSADPSIGREAEPLTQAQIDNIIRVGRELSELQGWTATRPISPGDLGASCYEHRESVRWGGSYTACPSGRIPWDILIPAINKEERVYTDEQIDAKIGEALALGVRNQNNIKDLANGQDALPPIKGMLRYLWALAGKPWPF